MKPCHNSPIVEAKTNTYAPGILKKRSKQKEKQKCKPITAAEYILNLFLAVFSVKGLLSLPTGIQKKQTLNKTKVDSIRKMVVNEGVNKGVTFLVNSPSTVKIKVLVKRQFA